MNKKVISRSTTVDTDRCVELVGGNRFEMMLIATVRAREISQRNKDSDKHEHMHSAITALLEIQEGKIGREYLKRVR